MIAPFAEAPVNVSEFPAQIGFWLSDITDMGMLFTITGAVFAVAGPHALLAVNV